MLRFVFGMVLAGLAAFAFGAAYWMGPAGWSAMSPVADDDAAQAALARAFPATGSYVVPQDMGAPDEAAWVARHEKGPLAVLHVQAEGQSPLRPSVLLRGLLHSFSVAALLGFLLKLMGPALPTWRTRFLFVTLVGLVAAVQVELGAHVWWLHSSAWTATAAVYQVGVFAVQGAVLGALLRPPGAAA